MKRITTFLAVMLCAVAAIFADTLSGTEGTAACYLAANTKQADGSYVDRYLYVNGSGALANSTEFKLDDGSYTWELIANGTDGYHVKNGTGKYLSYANKSLIVADAAYNFQLKDDAVHTGVGGQVAL